MLRCVRSKHGFPMNESDFVCGVESSTDLDHDRKDSVHRQRLGVTLLDAENLGQRRTFDEFHRQELFAQVFADVVHPRNVLVGDAAGQPDLAAEAIQDARDAHHFTAQHFEGDRFAQLNVAGSVDGAGAAAADESLKLVATTK